jgi:hypothetical protein
VNPTEEDEQSFVIDNLCFVQKVMETCVEVNNSLAPGTTLTVVDYVAQLVAGVSDKLDPETWDDEQTVLTVVHTFVISCLHENYPEIAQALVKLRKLVEERS